MIVFSNSNYFLQALQDSPNIQKFCFVSESCLPIATVEQCLNRCYCCNVDDDDDDDDNSLQCSSRSIMSYSSVPNNGYAKQLQVRS